jgi:NAD(P)-dependent dehydrogenase (short-subunit alcohol dehydrogenase family)
MVGYITGGGAGLGRATATELAGHGFAVAIFNLHLEAAESAAVDIIAAGGQAIALGGDIASQDAQADAIESTVAHYGRLDSREPVPSQSV